MRVKYSKLFTFLIITINIALVYFTWKLLVAPLTIPQQSGGFVGTEHPSVVAAATAAAIQKPRDRIQSANKHIKKTVSIVFRDFYHFDTDLKASIDSVLALIPAIHIYVVYDEEPYPPLEFFANYTIMKNVHFVNLAFDVRRTAASGGGGQTMWPLQLIKTRYTLLLPDSIRLGGRVIIQKMLKEIGSGTDVMTDSGKDGSIVADKTTTKEKKQRKLMAIPFASGMGAANCCAISLDFPNWTLEYSLRNGSDNCDMFLQKHGILIETSILKEMPDALSAPYPEMLYVQAKILKVKKLQLSANMQDGKRLFIAYHNKQRRKEIRRHQFHEMYKRLLIKKVVRKQMPRPVTSGSVFKMDKQNKKHRNSAVGGGGGGAPAAAATIDVYAAGGGGGIGGNGKPVEQLPSFNSSTLMTTIEYYGCEKNTKSCVGAVYNGRPFYVYQEKHTPPCCLEKLRSVFHHVLDELENVGIRYWLDNHALKGAIDTNVLTPDAFEIDIGFNAFDLERSTYLKKSQSRPLIDPANFYWIKATDGQYFRVQYSKQNQIGLNLLPFDVDADRVVPSGFYGWKAKGFSSEYLHPMSTVVFLGKNVMCPNNVKEFLDLKGIK